jgi:Tfp pilus assembly protein PilN
MRFRTALVTRSIVLVTAVLAGVFGFAPAALAEDEGSTALLEKLEAASKGYLDAKTKLENSKAKQTQISTDLSMLENKLADQTAALQIMAAAAYRSGPMASMASFLDGSPETFIDRMTMLDVIAGNTDEVLRQVTASRNSARDTKAALDAEVAQEQKQLAEMASRKAAAERALRDAGGGQATGGFGSSSTIAVPAPRNPDGSWPAQSCVIDDPTTSGCITARTLHSLQQAKAAGFTRYVSCYRSGGGGEHPKGRACDFAAAVGGFGGTATGGDRTYGNNLASFFIFNASRLGVLYVIWYRQSWLPGSGWRSYSGSGSPAADHTNHVHLSVY